MKPIYLKKIDGLVGRALSLLWPRPRATVFHAPPRRVMVIRPGGIGDALLLVPLLQTLRRAWPGVRLAVLAERRNAGAFALCEEIDELFLYDRPREFFGLLGQSWDLVIDTEQWHHLSALVGRLLRPQYSIGFGTNSRRRLFNATVDYHQERYEAESFLGLLEPLGLELPQFTDRRFLSLPAGEDGASAAEGLSHPYLVLFPGASIPERQWGRHNFAALARELLNRDYGVVLVGGGEDREQASAIEGLCPGVVNRVGETSLVGTAAILQQAELLVSGDSGVLHLAVGLGTGSVSLFGSGIEQKWAPRGERHLVINHHLDCSPCTRFGYTPACPIDARCISGIKVAEVLAACLALLHKEKDA